VSAGEAEAAKTPSPKTRVREKMVVPRVLERMVMGLFLYLINFLIMNLPQKLKISKEHVDFVNNTL